MKSFKLLLSVIALVAFTAAPALRAQVAPVTPAPDTSHRKGHHGDDLKKLAATLALTDAQVTQIKPIMKDAKQAMKTLKADATLDKKAKHEKMKEVRQSHMTQILAILTPDQQAKFKAMREKHHHKRSAA
jgi:Spy/CpxP family protein refolding chaperone